MSFLSAIIIPKLIDALEQEILNHAPDIQEALWKEIQDFCTKALALIESKLNTSKIG